MINHGSFDNLQMQMMLVQLADRLAKAKGKKQYGYLNANTKKLVDAIVAELAKDNRIQELYSLWYEQREDVLRTYTNKMPQRIPLEQEKEFRTIRNVVVQAALQLQLPQEELPLSDPVPPRVDFVDDSSDVYPKAIESLREPEVEPDPEVRQFLHEAAIHGRLLTKVNTLWTFSPESEMAAPAGFEPAYSGETVRSLNRSAKGSSIKIAV